MSTSESDRDRESYAGVDGYNAGYAEELAEGRLRERGMVPPSLADWAENGERAAPRAPAPAAEAAAAGPETLRAVHVAAALVQAHREHGHLAVELDPLGSGAPGHPYLDPGYWEMDEERLADVPASALGMDHLGDDMREVLGRLREVYCSSIAYEVAHVEEPVRRDWLLEAAESGRHRRELSGEEARSLLERLTRVEGLEQFIHRAYLGKKRFSVEGLDMMVPMMEELIERSADDGTREVLIGMAHRGRLNVLAHIVGRSYRSILAEFEGLEELGLQSSVAGQGLGDVKYHVGARGRYDTASGKQIDVSMAPNPSHLEHVNPVVEGMARAARGLWARGERREGVEPLGLELPEGPEPGSGTARAHGHEGPEVHAGGEASRAVLPVLVHGDAAFMGQGVAAETLNLSRLQGYETGGTVHLVANNQLGFTTRPEDGRSSRYASDLARAFGMPVLHVNADRPEACLEAVRFAAEYRREFQEDVIVDLVGYRRYGHNEGDEPSYTQPGMYETIEDHPTVRDQLVERLAEEGVVTEDEAADMADEVNDRLHAVKDELAEAGEEAAAEGDEVAETPQGEGSTTFVAEPDVKTAVAVERLEELNRGIHAWPDDFQPFEKLTGLMNNRRERLHEAVDWAYAEALAFASLVTDDAVAVRLAGEDSERGTFSQRHLVLHSDDGERTYIPLRHLEDDQATFEVWNSPLSEVAALGFEYGYSAMATDSLVLWEAQYGDFVNVGQAIIDQFVVAGRAKWGQESRLTMLLPHGYEGQGPEHSSGRMERFLQLAAQHNIRVANCTTPAQYFHLLRLQALRPDRRPLIIMTPKSLLRHPQARSTSDDLSEGRFRPVLPDGAVGDDADVRRAVLCTGKMYYDLTGSDLREEHPETALIRVERLYPFPGEEIGAALSALEGLEDVVWAQEEPENMGAWRYLRPRLEGLLEGSDAIGTGEVGLRYAGRPAMASPAEGFHSQHEANQERIVREAFGEDPGEVHPSGASKSGEQRRADADPAAGAD
ncbi:MAG: 2-oxoglutarate dehydrogenase E1 component [Candidatus Palauibacterales bacterium]|nr:2-oxoglutarate dehydrogenase E1 component [Candidatus Palauibacterales bacterium]